MPNRCWGDPKAGVEDSLTETGKEENYNKRWMFDIVIALSVWNLILLETYRRNV